MNPNWSIDSADAAFCLKRRYFWKKRGYF